MHKKIPKICTGCRVSAAKIYLYHSTEIAKARPHSEEWQTDTSVHDLGYLFVVFWVIDFLYRGSPPYAFFGTWKKPCYMKLVLVGLYCGPLLTLIPPLTRT